MRGGARESPLHTWLVSVQQRGGVKRPRSGRLWKKGRGREEREKEKEREKETRRKEKIKEIY